MEYILLASQNSLRSESSNQALPGHKLPCCSATGARGGQMQALVHPGGAPACILQRRLAVCCPPSHAGR